MSRPLPRTLSVGPWELDPTASHPWKVRAPYADGPPGYATIVEVGYRPNAVAIAATPELLELVEESLYHLRLDDAAKNYHNRALAIIAKAKGLDR